MSFVGAVVGGLAGAAGTAVIGQLLGGSQQAAGYQAGYGTDMLMFNTINSQEQPFIQSGTTALNALMGGLGLGGNTNGTGMLSGQLTAGFSPTDFTNNLDPGYGFQLQTGAQAVRNADTPAQGALSGSALKDLMLFNSGMASTGYQNAFNRWNTTQNNIFSRLNGIAGLGQNAASNVGTAGTTLGTNAASMQAGAGTATGAATVGASNALSGAAVPLAYLMAGNNTNNQTVYSNGSTTTDTAGLTSYGDTGWVNAGAGGAT